MTAQDKIQVVERYTDEVWNKGNLDVIDELLADDYTHQTPPPGFEGTREGFKKFARMARTAMPDLHNTTEEIFAHEDKVVQRWTGRGTHQGEFMGTKPTGKKVEFSGISILRVQDGKITEDWTRADMMGLLQQMGAIPKAA